MIPTRQTVLWTLVAAAALLVVPGCGSAPTEPGVGDDVVARLQLLADYGDPTDDDMAFVAALLDDGNEEERALAAWTAGNLGAQELSASLIELAHADGSPTVRVNATRALGKLNGEEVVDSLVRLLSDADDSVRGAALGALADPRHVAAHEALCDVLTSSDDGSRPTAADALVAFHDQRTAPCLLDALEDPLAAVRSVAAFGLGRLGHAPALDALVALLDDPQWEVRANAAQALGMIGSPAARQHLERATRDEYGAVQDAARAALRKLP